MTNRIRLYLQSLALANSAGLLGVTASAWRKMS